MFSNNGNKILTSDWHLLHKNIFLYEFDKRKQFLKDSIKNIDTIFPDIWNNFENKTFKEKEIIYKEIKQKIFWIKSNSDVNSLIINANSKFLNLAYHTLEKMNLSWIKEFYNLGDFIFGLNDEKINIINNSRLHTEINKIHDFFKKKNITRTLILWNHDHYSLSDISVVSYYNTLYDEVCLYKNEWREYFTHHPLWSSNGYFVPKGVFWNIDQEILIKNKKGWLINHHWHIHNNPLDHRESWISYFNYSIEEFL